MSDIVDETLRYWRQTPFEYGQHDCLLSIGDYIAITGGVDISATFRGKYYSEQEARNFVHQHEGPQGLIDLTGLPQIDPCDAVRGDVVVLDTGTGSDGSVGAICTGQGVAARLERGVIEIDLKYVKITHAWKVGQCQQ